MEQINIMLYAGAIVLGAFHALEPGHGKTLIGENLELGRRLGIGSAIIITALGVITFFHSLNNIIPQ